jgi:hypothetical protein
MNELRVKLLQDLEMYELAVLRTRRNWTHAHFTSPHRSHDPDLPTSREFRQESEALLVGRTYARISSVGRYCS